MTPGRRPRTIAGMDGGIGKSIPESPLAALLRRCDFARLRPDRVPALCAEFEIGGDDCSEAEEDRRSSASLD